MLFRSQMAMDAQRHGQQMRQTAQSHALNLQAQRERNRIQAEQAAKQSRKPKAESKKE